MDALGTAIAGKSRESNDFRAREAKKVKISKLDAKLEKAKEKLIAQQRKIAEIEEKIEEQVGKAAGKRLADDEGKVRKKVKYSENPFLVEKSSYNRRLFEVNNPFCTVFSVNSLKSMPADKVCDGKTMNKDALKAAVDVLLEPVVETRRRYKRSRTELGGRIIHASALHGVKWLTLPSGTSMKPKVADAILSAGGKAVILPRDEASVHESDELMHEGGNAVDWKEFVSVEKYDLKGQVHDLSIQDDDDLVTVLLVECDWEGSLNKVYQGSAYGISAARSNLRKGCDKPLYIENWSKDSWRYGVLRPQAIVTVEAGRVIGVKGPRSVPSLHDLQEQLDKHTKTLQDDYISPSEYPSGDHVLGTLYVCEQELALPNTFQDRYLSINGLRFLQSLVRIFVGDERALTLTVEDIHRNVETRRAEGQEELRTFTDTFENAYDLLVASGSRSQDDRKPVAASIQTQTRGGLDAVNGSQQKSAGRRRRRALQN